MAQARSLFCVALIASATACRSGEDSPVTCAAPYVARGDTCVPRFDTCGSAEVPILGGGCAAAGVPVDGCAEGFSHDGNGGCTPVLPAAACPRGKIAVPGDTACREIAACGEGTWGAIPVEPSTIFVDGSVATTGDGSKPSPFKTVNEAVAKVRIGIRPIVAIAAGTYVEDVTLERDVRLWGRCPSMVELRGTDAMYSAIETYANAQVRGLAVTGPGPGIVIAAGGKGELEDVWVHDTTRWGVAVYGIGEPEEHPATMRNVLIEDARDFGVNLFGGTATIEASAIRDAGGMGVRAEYHAKSKTVAQLALRRSLVERAHEAGVASLAAKVTVRGSVIRDTEGRKSDKRAGTGTLAIPHSTGAPGHLDVIQSYFSGNRRSGVYWDNATGTLDRTVVRDSRPMEADGRYGNGAQIIFGADVSVVDSLIVGNMSSGLAFSGGKGTVVRTLVRDGRTSASGFYGAGVYVWSGRAVGSEVTIRGSRIENNFEGAVIVGGSRATIEDSLLLGTKASERALFGDGLTVTASLDKDAPAELAATASLVRCLVSNNARAGVLVAGSTLSVSDSALLCNAIDLVFTSLVGTKGGAPFSMPYSVEPSGVVGCGCGGAATTCKGHQTSLEPMTAPEMD